MNEWEGFWKSKSVPEKILSFVREIYVSRVIARYILSLSEPGYRKVLEMGCGTGGTLQVLSSEFDVYGIDSSKPALEKLGTRKADIKARLGDVLHTGIPDEEFDIVFSQGVIEHVNDPANFVSESCRITKPGGKVVIIVASTHPFHYVFYRLTRRGPLRMIYPWKDVVPEKIENRNQERISKDEFYFLKFQDIVPSSNSLDMRSEIVPRTFGLLMSVVLEKCASKY